EDLFVYVYVLVDDALLSGAIAIGPGRGRCLAAATLSCWPSRWCGICWAGAARPGFWPRWPGTGRTCSRACRTKARRTGGSAGYGGHSSSCGPCWRPGCPKMTASRSIPPRCRSSTPPGSAARTAGPGRATTWPPGSAATPHTPNGPCGFGAAIKTDLGSGIVRPWAIVPAAVNERQVAEDLLGAGPWPRDLLADKGFNGKAFAAAQAARGTAVLVPPAKNQHAAMASILLKVIAQWRNRIETTFSEITNLMELARHGAHTFWGLLTRTAATIAAHTLLRTCLFVA